MATNNNHTVQPIVGEDPSEIITTLNHNFQVLTERIKDLNVNLSYLDILKIADIFKTDGGADAQQTFAATCWNTLANYAGVYIQSDSSEILFTWMGEPIHRGDFIIKLPNNQSLHLAGEESKYFVPTSYSTTNNILSFNQVTSTSAATSVTIDIFSTIASSTMLEAGSTTYSAGASIEVYKDCRFYDVNGEEIFFSEYVPGTAFTVPVAVTAQYIKQGS